MRCGKRGFFFFKVKKLRIVLKVNIGKCFYEFIVLFVYEIICKVVDI